MNSFIGLRFKDNSSGLFEIIGKQTRNLKRYYLIRFIERPKEGELTIAKIENAISYNEFLLSEKAFNELVTLNIIKEI